VLGDGKERRLVGGDAAPPYRLGRERKGRRQAPADARRWTQMGKGWRMEDGGWKRPEECHGSFGQGNNAVAFHSVSWDGRSDVT
jgi:hypothetical protein